MSADESITVRIPSSLLDEIQGLLFTRESRADFIRKAIAHEIAARRALKEVADVR